MEDLLVQLDDDDFNAQVAQASAAVEAAKADIEDNRRQREFEGTRIERALAGVDRANAPIVAAQAGKEAAQADVVRTGQLQTTTRSFCMAHENPYAVSTSEQLRAL